ncbi:hypothetical protein CCHR01_01310 [Colletotrichum chrysophilum]|uniref:Uncharacterized protein n=1 Tax=Colletotrichum chrysophilum TaxID=1836956 RepID=A0AAD9ETH1_9PEZI|nr:hypothetical protein CCHR01_01310 [Colletotrichum chrysophilum]
MKVSISLLLAAIATTVSAGGPHGWGHPNLDKISPDKPLPLHQLPECYQSCFQSENNAYGGGDFNTISQRDFCEDKWGHASSWMKTFGLSCSIRECKDREDGNRMLRWYNSICMI